MARIEWESTGDHEYTGLFTGADTGFIRLSAAVLVITPDEAADNPGKPSLVPSLAVKLLRDGVDSGNTVGNAPPLYDNYHFFENDIVTNILSLDEIYDENSLMRGRDASRFFGSVGHSNLASHDQDGQLVENPIFPFSMRFEVNPELKYEDTEYKETFQDQLAKIDYPTRLFSVYARSAPENQPGETVDEQLIGYVNLESQLVTSKFADEKMFFRHQRQDDDFRLVPEWIEPFNEDEITAVLLEGEEIEIKPYIEPRYSSCPFSTLFELF